MVIIHLTKHFHSGFVKSMAVIPGNSEQSAKNVITILLNSFDHRCHCRAIQPELDCILSQAKVVEWEEVRVSLDDVGAVLLQDQPGGGEGGTGYQKGLHCPLVSQVGVPAVWEGTQASPVPRNPVARECLHPVPARQQSSLCGCLLNLPGGGPTRPEYGVALGQSKEPGLEVEEG